MSNLADVWERSTPIKEDLSAVWEQSKPVEQAVEPVQQPKIGALKSNPQFSDEPDFMGEGVGEPTMEFGKTALDILNTPNIPLQETLRSPGAAYTAEDPYQDMEIKGASILDFAGQATGGVLEQGAATEALPYQAATPENFGDVADTVGRTLTELGATTAYYGALSKIAGGFNEIKLVAKNYDRQIRTAVTKGVNEGIKLPQRGKMNIKDYNRYVDKTSETVKDIIKNKETLNLTDSNGFPIKDVIPEGKVALKQYSEAINQRMEAIWKEGDALVKEATGIGAVVDMEKIGTQIEDMATRSLRIGDETAYGYALEIAKKYKTEGSIPASEAVESIKRINSRIQGQIQSGKKGFTMSGRGYVDYEANVLIRRELDSIIENLTGERYQSIRNKYAAYKSIEKDVLNRMIVDARKNKYGVMNIMDVFSGYHAVKGLLTLDPVTMTAAGSSKIISILERAAVDPNRNIAKMFKNVERMMKERNALISQ